MGVEILLAIIILNVFLFFLPFLVNFQGSSPSSFVNFLEMGWKDNTSIADGEIYRLLTSNFLHGGVFHLFINMYSIWAIGPSILTIFNPFGFFVIYLFSGIGGSYASFLMNASPSVGASGSIFGLVGSLFYYSLTTSNTSLLSNLFFILIINLAIGFTPGSNIDNWGHIGGLISGFLIAFAVRQVGMAGF